MGERFGTLFRGVKHYGQETKRCCTAAFSGAWGPKSFRNSQRNWRRSCYSARQINRVFWAQEEYSFWKTSLSSGSTRVDWKHGFVRDAFTEPCKVLRVWQCIWNDSRPCRCLINVPRTLFAVDCYEKLTLHWMDFYRSLDQSKRLSYMLLKWRRRLISPGRSKRFVVGLKDKIKWEKQGKFAVASTKKCEEFYCRFGGKCQCNGQRYL